MLYGLAAWLAEIHRPRARTGATSRPAGDYPSVSVLKPLCGMEPETYSYLRSFCEQDYPDFQVIFGIADATDPVTEVARRLQQEFPLLDIQLVIDRKQHGASRKVSNLINMLQRAGNDVLVLSDSDVCVSHGYLREVTAPLHDAGVGVVTCAYRGIPRRGIWGLLGAQFVNEWFIPSVQVAAKGGSRSFAFGATIALRRQVLARIGGFGKIADQLADDYRLGELTRELGLRTVLSETQVDIAISEQTFRELALHELRWLRTIRAVRPLAYCFYCVTFGIPLALLGALLSRGATAELLMLAITCCARIALHFRKRRHGRVLLQMALVPVRDCLSLGLWTLSFITRRVSWRGDIYRIERDGSVLQT
jgi:ceramide glucosyltransferase